MNKLLKLLFTLSVITMAFACGKDDDTSSSSDNPFVGSWKLSAVTLDAEATTNVGGQTIVSMTDAVGSNMTYTINFTEDAYTTSGGFDLTTTTTVSGIPQTSTNSFTNIDNSGTYTYTETTITASEGLVNVDLDGTTATSNTNTDPQEYTIDSNGDLVFESSETKTEDVGGVTTVTTSTSMSRWVKQ